MIKQLQVMFITAAMLLGAHALLAQGMLHTSHDGLWPDSLTTVEITGTVIVDSTSFHALYFLDENGDRTPDYHLSFGPWWYQPDNGATRPSDGETVAIKGGLAGNGALPNLTVFEIDGAVWREAVAYGGRGWNGSPFWDSNGDTLTATGTVMLDTSYFYTHYFLDTDADSIPDYQLDFGPPWYLPESGATRPDDGAQVTVFGRVHGMAGIVTLAIYDIDGLEWRAPGRPAPWAGMWMNRSHADTTFAYCVTDSTTWIGFAPGNMGHGGMGGMNWPDSAFVQFWEIHPDSLPGGHNDEHVRGFYLNSHDPLGQSMMGGQFGGGRGGMRFQENHRLRFTYSDDDLQRHGLAESGLAVAYWDAANQTWVTATNVTVDTQTNTASFVSSALNNYYVLTAPATTTGVDASAAVRPPSGFVLQQNFPNPFNPETTIKFKLPTRALVRVSVFNLLGQRVALLLNEKREAGSYALSWNGSDDSGRQLSSGIYIVRLAADGRSLVRRVTLLK